MKKETLGTILAVLTAVISGISIPLNKIFVVNLEPAVFTAVRALIIGLIFLAFAGWSSKRSKNPFRKVPWKYLILIGIIGGGLAFLLYFTGLSLTTTSRAAFLHKTLPIYTTVLAFIFLKEKVSRRQSLGLLGMLFGTFLIVSSQINPAEFWTNPQLGDMLVLIATMLWGIENVLAKYALIKDESNLVVSFARMFIGAIFLFSAVLALGKMDALFSLSFQQLGNVLISTGLLFGYVFCYYWSIKLINVSKAASLLLIAPVITLFIGVYVFGEPLPWLQRIGSILILAGAFVVAKERSVLNSGV
ncbi:MAG: DMT family transporter [Candidatus Aenigmarchaeota archaeon]|nr:DMT family transporter [Candidatus Aenigmarchaeota archaeon]